MSIELRAEIINTTKHALNGSQHSFTTVDMIDMLEGFYGDRRKIANILMDAAKRELCAYATQGEPEAGRGYQMGKIVRRWTWHAPIAGREPEAKAAPITLVDVMAKLASIEDMLRLIEARQ